VTVFLAESAMSAPVASKIRRPSSPSMAGRRTCSAGECSRRPSMTQVR
jgi:hypothetical protein